jgi:dihydrofolate reductase
MGRKNYESLPDNYRPLPGRKNIILTKNPLWQPKEEDDENIFVVSSFWEALELAENLKGKEICFIGGADIYKLALENVILDKIHRTLVYAPGLKGDTFFPTEVIPRLIPSYKMFYNETFLSDTRHPYPFSIESWERT